MRRIIRAAVIAVTLLIPMLSTPAQAGSVYGHYVPDSILDEYRWEGGDAYNGRWVDKTCDQETYSFSARMWVSINEGGHEVKVCGNEANLCDVPMDPPGEWNTDPCSAPLGLSPRANDTISDVHITFSASGGKVCLYRDADWGGLWSYLWSGQAFHNMGYSNTGNDLLSSLRWRAATGAPC